MTWRYLTQYLVISNVLALVLYTAAARVFGGNEATVSYVVAEAARKWPVVAAGIGFVAGHWLWPVK